MGGQRLHAHLRGLPAARRARGRPAGRRKRVHRRAGLFAAASLVGGLAQSQTMLIVARARPGPGRRGGRARHARRSSPAPSPRAASATARWAPGARWAPWAGRRASCWAACSPRRSAGAGSSSSTCRSARPPHSRAALRAEGARSRPRPELRSRGRHLRHAGPGRARLRHRPDGRYGWGSARTLGHARDRGGPARPRSC